MSCPLSLYYPQYPYNVPQVVLPTSYDVSIDQAFDLARGDFTPTNLLPLAIITSTRSLSIYVSDGPTGRISFT